MDDCDQSTGMRRFLVLLLALLFVVMAAVPAVAAAEEVLGYRVTYVPGPGRIALDGGVSVTLQVGSDRADVGGAKVQLRAPVVEREGRAFVSDDLLGQLGLNVGRRGGAIRVFPQPFWPARDQAEALKGIRRIFDLLDAVPILCPDGC